MTEPNPKDKPAIKTRTPGKAMPSGFANLRTPANLDVEEILGLSEQSHDASLLPQVDTTETILRPRPDQTQTKPRPTAPERDYNKRANSLDRVALPAGLFPGASKRLYDALYIRTRGAVVAKRTVQATRRELMQWSDIRDIKTVNVHLRRLKVSGLLAALNSPGEHEGCMYEVFLPEETSPDQTQTNPVPSPSQKTDSDQDQKTVWVGSGNLVENKDTSTDPKTSFKTKDQDDDETFTGLVEKLRKAARELTGKDAPAAEGKQWAEVADIIVAELKTAAARTTVSSVPSFLAEHLRRKFARSTDAKREGKRATVATEPVPLTPEEIEPPAPDELAEFERARAELEGKSSA